MNITSPKWDLIKQDLVKIGKGALIALGGAAVVYLSQVSGMIDYSNFGIWGAIVAALVTSFSSVLINVLNKWINSSTYTK
jgi:tartrate dehydratase beta subunit/fumarate hydratase class I family protein